MTLPSMFRPASRSDFIGPARRQAEIIERTVAACLAGGRAPIKLLLLGKPGTGKTELAEHFCRTVGASKWATHKFNGTQLKIEDVEELSRTVRYTNTFGDYRVIRVEEVDRVPSVAQVRLLTLLDDLPPGNSVICTSNCKLKDLEERFQSRFQLMEVIAPSDAEVSCLITTRWGVSPSIATHIATMASGNVRQALLDAQTFLCA